MIENSEKVEFAVEESAGDFKLKTNLYKLMGAAAGGVPTCKLMHTDDMKMAFEPEQKFENPDGTPITFDTDYFGKKRGEKVIPGPFCDGI